MALIMNNFSSGSLDDLTGTQVSASEVQAGDILAITWPGYYTGSVGGDATLSNGTALSAIISGTGGGTAGPQFYSAIVKATTTGTMPSVSANRWAPSGTILAFRLEV